MNLLTELNDRARCLWSILDTEELAILDVHPLEELVGTVLDFGVDRIGTLEGGILLAEICMAGLATVQITGQFSDELLLPMVEVTTDHPLLACMASQYAGWAFSYDEYFSMCSGPARIARGKEDVLTEYGLVAKTDSVVGVLETGSLPDETQIRAFAEACKCVPENTSICAARTSSLPGTVQVVARSVETAMHKLHELGFDLRNVLRGFGRAPLAPVAATDLAALGWTNDSILYGATAWLWVSCDDAAIEKTGPQIPSSASSDFGTPFLETFNRYERDFYRIDKLLFSPARIVIHNVKTGRTFSYGDVRPDILKNSFSIA